MIYISILLGILFGFSCSELAKNRGRNPRIWFILGLLFGIFGLITILILPRVKVSDAPAQANKSFPQYEELQSKSTEEEHHESINSPPSQNELFQMNTWYFLDKTHTQTGPVDFNKLVQEFREEKISPDSYVWSEGMADWQKIHQVHGLLELIDEF